MDADKDIIKYSREPVYPWVFFGDGYAAQLIDSWIVKHQDGSRRVRLEMRVDEALAMHHGLKEVDYTDEGTVLMEYPYIHHEILNDSPLYSRRLVMCGFKGGLTRLTERESHFTLQNSYLEREIKSLNALIQRQSEQLELMRGNLRQWARDTNAIMDEFKGPNASYASEMMNVDNEVNREILPGQMVQAPPRRMMQSAMDMMGGP